MVFSRWGAALIAAGTLAVGGLAAAEVTGPPAPGQPPAAPPGAAPNVATAVPDRAASPSVPMRSPVAARTAAVVAYTWPTGSPAAVLRPFDRPAQRWLAGHRGVDLELAVGAPVRAAGDGVVAFAGPVADRPVVSVQHGDGIRTTYEPVTPAVAAGQSVRSGDVLGTLATGGHCAGCLHWGARRGSDDYLDPLSLLVQPVRLLPD